MRFRDPDRAETEFIYQLMLVGGLLHAAPPSDAHVFSHSTVRFSNPNGASRLSPDAIPSH